MKLKEFIAWAMSNNLSGEEELTFLEDVPLFGKNITLNCPEIIDKNNSSLSEPIIRFQLGRL